MALRNYNINENAVVAAAAGSVTAGYAACLDATYTGYVTATTANRALLSGGRLSGVFIGTAVEGDTVPIVGSGHVEADVIGALGGSGDYVNVQSNGSLVRSSTLSSDSIGFYMADGSIEVNTSLQFGGAVTGNATAIQGVAVSSASAARSYVMAGNSTSIRMRRGTYNFLDWSPDETGATDMSALLLTAMNEIPNNSDLIIPLPSAYFRLNSPIVYGDDVEHGNKRGVVLIGEGPQTQSGGKYHFGVTMPRLGGYTASITARTNGGSGDLHTTVELIPTPGSGASGVTPSMLSRLRGKALVHWNAATGANRGESIIVDIPSNDVVRVSNQNSGAAGTDANNGALHWYIDESVITFAARNCGLVNVNFGLMAGAKIGNFVEFAHPSGQTAGASVRCYAHGCVMSNDNGPGVTQLFRDGFKIARDIVPTHSGNYAWSTGGGGLNGLGEYQVGAPPQVDTVEFVHCNVTYASRSGMAFYSTTAQSKENRVVECGFAGSPAKPMQYGAMVPKDLLTSGTTWSAVGNAHWDTYRCSLGYLGDAAFQIGGYGSKEFLFQGNYSENVTYFLRAGTNTTNVPISLRENSLAGSLAYAHRSGLFVETNGAGPLKIEGGYVAPGGDGHGLHIDCRAISTTLENNISFKNWWLYGRSDYTVRWAVRTSTLRFPIVLLLDGTEKLSFGTNGGAQVDIALTQADFNTACFYTVDRHEIHAWEMAAWINSKYAGLSAWGHGDDSYLSVRSKTLTAAGAVQCFVPGAGVDANAQMGIPLGLAANSGSVTLLQTKSSGLIDWTQAAGTGGLVAGTLENVQLTQSAPYVSLPCNEGSFSLNDAGAYGKLMAENLKGISGSSAVEIRNFGGQVTISAAATVATVTFATAEADANYRIGRLTVTPGAGFAAGSTRAYVTNKTTAGFDINLEVAPGGAVANLVDWGIER